MSDLMESNSFCGELKSTPVVVFSDVNNEAMNGPGPWSMFSPVSRSISATTCWIVTPISVRNCEMESKIVDGSARSMPVASLIPANSESRNSTGPWSSTSPVASVNAARTSSKVGRPPAHCSSCSTAEPNGPGTNNPCTACTTDAMMLSSSCFRICCS